MQLPCAIYNYDKNAVKELLKKQLEWGQPGRPPMMVQLILVPLATQPIVLTYTNGNSLDTWNLSILKMVLNELNQVKLMNGPTSVVDLVLTYNLVPNNKGLIG